MNLEHLSEKFELNDLEKQIVRYIQEHLTDLKVNWYTSNGKR